MATYNYTNGDGVDTLDATTPNGATEPVSVLDDAVRQIKAFLKDPSAGVKSLISRITAAEGTITTIQNTLNSTTPIGCVIPFAGPAAPAGWLICDGSAVFRTTYSSLFSLIGVTYGIGNGTTTFNLPDMRGRVPLGPDESTNRVPGAVLGGTGGVHEQTLTVAQLPSHIHSFRIGGEGDYAENQPWVVPTTNYPGKDGLIFAAGEYDGDRQVLTFRDGVIGSTQPMTGPVLPEGDGAAHNNVQPYLCLKFIIKY